MLITDQVFKIRSLETANFTIVFATVLSQRRRRQLKFEACLRRSHRLIKVSQVVVLKVSSLTTSLETFSFFFFFFFFSKRHLDHHVVVCLFLHCISLRCLQPDFLLNLTWDRDVIKKRGKGNQVTPWSVIFLLSDCFIRFKVSRQQQQDDFMHALCLRHSCYVIWLKIKKQSCVGSSLSCCFGSQGSKSSFESRHWLTRDVKHRQMIFESRTWSLHHLKCHFPFSSPE